MSRFVRSRFLWERHDHTEEKVKPGLGEGDSWVECGSCGAGWQVADYAESAG